MSYPNVNSSEIIFSFSNLDHYLISAIGIVLIKARGGSRG